MHGGCGRNADYLPTSVLENTHTMCGIISYPADKYSTTRRIINCPANNDTQHEKIINCIAVFRVAIEIFLWVNKCHTVFQSLILNN